MVETLDPHYARAGHVTGWKVRCGPRLKTSRNSWSSIAKA